MSSCKVNHKQFIIENVEVKFSEEVLDKFKQITKRYPEGRQKSALLPILHIAQEESGGYLSADVMNFIANFLQIQPIEVFEVASFYTQFYNEKQGKFVIEICRTGPCAICGGERISDYLQKKLAIGLDETTADGLFTIKEVECLGACGSAPVMQINTEFYEFLNEEKIDSIIENLKENSTLEQPKEEKWTERFF